MTANFCPSCGLDLARDEEITRGALTIDPHRRSVLWHGQAVHLTPSEFTVLHSLAKADGRLVSNAALMERTGSSADTNPVAVWVHRVRAALGAVNAGFSIKAVSGQGYMLAVDHLTSAGVK